MATKAKLSLKTQGIKCGTPQWKEELGYAACYLNDKDRHVIAVDAFSGSGTNYKRREENLINIFNDNRMVFSGTIEELVSKLSTK